MEILKLNTYVQHKWFDMYEKSTDGIVCFKHFDKSYGDSRHVLMTCTLKRHKALDGLYVVGTPMIRIHTHTNAAKTCSIKQCHNLTSAQTCTFYVWHFVLKFITLEKMLGIIKVVIFLPPQENPPHQTHDWKACV